MASTSNTTTTSTSSKPSSSDPSTTIHLSSNFAAKHQSSPSVEFDHEIYLQLMAGDSQAVPKTPNQVYREERARHRKSRSLDPAITDPQGDPGPIDFECAEKSQLEHEDQSGRKGG